MQFLVYGILFIIAAALIIALVVGVTLKLAGLLIMALIVVAAVTFVMNKVRSPRNRNMIGGPGPGERRR
jgi:membrane protein implicated in regulation of membrane protease activity